MVTDPEGIKDHLEHLFQVHHAPYHLILRTLGSEEMCAFAVITGLPSYIHLWALCSAFQSCFLFRLWFVSYLLLCQCWVRDTPWIVSSWKPHSSMSFSQRLWQLWEVDTGELLRINSLSDRWLRTHLCKSHLCKSSASDCLLVSLSGALQQFSLGGGGGVGLPFLSNVSAPARGVLKAGQDGQEADPTFDSLLG